MRLNRYMFKKIVSIMIINTFLAAGLVYPMEYNPARTNFTRQVKGALDKLKPKIYSEELLDVDEKEDLIGQMNEDGIMELRVPMKFWESEGQKPSVRPLHELKRAVSQVTFIDLLRANFTEPINLIDVGSGDKALFCFRVNKFLKQRSINGKAYGVSPAISGQAIQDAAQEGMVLYNMKLEDLVGVEAEKNKYNVVVLNAPDFQLENVDIFLKALGYILTEDGVVIIRPDAYRGDIAGALAQTFLWINIRLYFKDKWRVHDDIRLDMHNLTDETPLGEPLIFTRIGRELRMSTGFLDRILDPRQVDTRRDL